jgi:hypothetical protein
MADYSKFAADRGRLEGETNRARCRRLLGRWTPPDRSCETVSHPPSPDHLSEFFRDFRQSQNPRTMDDDERQFVSDLDRSKASTITPIISGALAMRRDLQWRFIRREIDNRF